jgi:superfamily II DNA helicase RecQ
VASEKPVFVEVGAEVSVPGGYDGVVEAITDVGISLRLPKAGLLTVRFGERVTVDGQAGELARPLSPLTEAADAALRTWRTARAKADGMPPYIVLSDKHLGGIAEALPASLAELRNCPGIGPAKLESYGEDILEVLEAVRGAAATA